MKNDMMVQLSWQRVRLATLAKWAESQSYPLRSRGDLVRYICDCVYKTITDNGFTPITTIDEATDILEQLGRGNLNPTSRYLKGFHTNIIEEDNSAGLDDEVKHLLGDPEFLERVKDKLTKEPPSDTI